MTILYNKTKELPKRLILRKSQTREEEILWARLRKNNLGFKCKRQYSVGSYVLDFYFPIKKLAIELDGLQHIEYKEYDDKRTEYLNTLDIKVIRFWNSEISGNIDSIIKKIIKELDSGSPSH